MFHHWKSVELVDKIDKCEKRTVFTLSDETLERRRKPRVVLTYHIAYPLLVTSNMLSLMGDDIVLKIARSGLAT